MSADSSSYYPPRARGWGRFRHVFWTVQRLVCLPALHVPKGTGAFILGFLLPGLALRLTGHWKIAWGVFALWVAALVVFLATLGYTWSSSMLAFMIVLHCLCVVYIVRRTRPDSDLRERIGESVLIFIGAICGYVLLTNVVGCFIEPVRYQNRVFVASHSGSHGQLHRGDWIAYQVHAFWQPGVRVNEGAGLGIVRALAGDHVEITPNELRVNDIVYPRVADMPEVADFVVPAHCCFVWADFAISGHAPNMQLTAMEMRLRLGTVSDEDVTGQVFHTWFFRKQL